MEYNLVLTITNQCARNCPHCVIPAEQVGEMLDYKKAMEFSQAIVHNFNLSSICITGGEPFEYDAKKKTIIDLIKGLRKITEYIPIIIQTRGFLPDGSGYEERIRNLTERALEQKFTYVGTSFDTFLPDAAERLQHTLSVVMDKQKLGNIIWTEKKNDGSFCLMEIVLAELGFMYIQNDSNNSHFVYEHVSNGKKIKVSKNLLAPLGRGKRLNIDFNDYKKRAAKIEEVRKEQMASHRDIILLWNGNFHFSTEINIFEAQPNGNVFNETLETALEKIKK